MRRGGEGVSRKARGVETEWDARLRLDEGGDVDLVEGGDAGRGGRAGWPETAFVISCRCLYTL